MSKKKKRVFSGPLPEFIASERAKVLSIESPCFTRYRQISEYELKRREKIRNMKMPSHPASQPRILYTAMGRPVYESMDEYKERVKKGNVKYLKKQKRIRQKKRNQIVEENRLRNQQHRLQEDCSHIIAEENVRNKISEALKDFNLGVKSNDVAKDELIEDQKS